MEESARFSQGTIYNDVLKGLSENQKYIPSKYFYDERGSELFEKITYLDEYYLTDAEINILKDNIDEIAKLAGRKAIIIEPGSGSSKKTRLLLENFDSPAAYIPVDISEEFLLKTVNNLRMEYPKITIIPVFEDYTSIFKLPNLGDEYDNQLVFYPGSTIGNFDPSDARSFLKNIASITDPNSSLIIGVDLKKDRETLEAAYNDSSGITADFNKNILRRLNRELNADFDLDTFSHRAFYNEKEGRIEMHLVSEIHQSVTIADREIEFEKGESIHTENSYKYTLDEFRNLVSESYSVKKVWTDENDYFSVQYLEKR